MAAPLSSVILAEDRLSPSPRDQIEDVIYLRDADHGVAISPA
jgi:hypothetical protein